MRVNNMEDRPRSRKETQAPDENECFGRAMRSARRRAALDGATAMQPALGSCGFERKRGELHYVLRNVSGELARFRVTNAGRLIWIG